MTYHLDNCGLTVTDRMQIPIQKIVLGSLLAVSAVAVRAQSKTSEATLPASPAAMQQSTPIDLALHPAGAPPSTPLDLALHPAGVPQSTPVDLTLHPAPALQSAPIDLSLHPAAVPKSAPIDPSMQPAAAALSGSIDLALQSTSAEVKRVARWVTDSGDNGGLPYLLIDKVNAKVFAFNPAGQLQGAAPALLGMSRGDRLLAPNSAPMSAMSPQSRITPAGRFVSRLAIDSHGKELLVLDYEAAISLHPVVRGTPAEHRAERLNSASAQDNRISFGCINVPAAFYSTIVSPAFTHTKGVVYVLPETSTASGLFGFQPDGAAAAPGTQQTSTGLNARTGQAGPAPDAR